MYSKYRYVLFTLMLIFATLVSAFPVAAQDSQTVNAGFSAEGVNEADAPDNGAIVLDDEAKAEIAFLDSITDGQLAELEKIIDKYSAQLDPLFKQEAATDLEKAQQTEKVFLPLIVGSANHQTQDESNAPVVAATISQSEAMQKVDQITVQIDQEFVALLTMEQKALFAQTPLAQVSQEIQSSSTQATDSTSTCYWGGRYGALGYYYATWARYYGYYDWQRVNNSSSYSNYYYNYYGQERGQTGTIYSGGAYMMAVQNIDPGSWDETGASYLSQARDNAYWGRYHAYQSWAKGSTYWGQTAYYRANSAHYYFNLGVSNMNSC